MGFMDKAKKMAEQAQAKLRVGVPQAIVLRELGY